MVLSTCILLCNHHHLPYPVPFSSWNIVSLVSCQPLVTSILPSPHMNITTLGTLCEWYHTAFNLWYMLVHLAWCLQGSAMLWHECQNSLFTYFIFLAALGFEFRALHLLGRCSVAWVIRLVLLVMVILEKGFHFLPRQAWFPILLF
jgi:hypothetical protein